jgi:hypothetical protein
MATISDVRANYGLRAVGTTTYPTGSGAVSLGIENQTVRLTDADVFYAIQALVVGSASDLVINTSTGAKTDSTAWTAGAAQVETATAAGTISGAGNASVVVTAAGMTGTPKTISVAVAGSDTAATWAGKVRTALAADTDVSALFTVGGASASIVLTRKATGTYTVGSNTVDTYAANDATLNISLDNGTCTGITTAATSANTTAGVLTAGCYVVGDGEDFEGNALVVIATDEIHGLIISASSVAGGATVSTAATMTDFSLPKGSSITLVDGTEGQIATETFTIEPTSTALITIICAGKA